MGGIFLFSCFEAKTREVLKNDFTRRIRKAVIENGAIEYRICRARFILGGDDAASKLTPQHTLETLGSAWNVQ